MDTYRFYVSVNAERSAEAGKPNSTVETNGVVDNLNKKMQITMNMETEEPEGTYSTKLERYLIDDMEYSKVVLDGAPG